MDWLGKAAEIRREVKATMKSGDHDKAWRLLHEEQECYTRHASRHRWTNTQLITLTGSIHEHFANILRKEKKDDDALAHILYWVKSDKRPEQYQATKTHEAKVRTYAKRCKFDQIPLDEIMRYAKSDQGYGNLQSIRSVISKWRHQS